MAMVVASLRQVRSFQYKRSKLVRERANERKDYNAKLSYVNHLLPGYGRLLWKILDSWKIINKGHFFKLKKPKK